MSKNILYPTLDNENFNVDIASRKEFNDNKYDIFKSNNIEQDSYKICNAEFELSPHQLFVKNYLSFNTPYNGLLLYHGLGTGKTCSSIGVAEEMRDYLKRLGITKRIIIVASPNVQENFKLQLFDERKLKLVNGLWNIESCIGNKLLKEINPMNMKGLSREKVISQIKTIIKTSYIFLGYIEFANYIIKTSRIESDVSEERREYLIKKKLQDKFNNRLIIIDEVHNIRITDENKNKKVAIELLKLVENVNNMKLLLLSATPMYNTYKEIVWLINILNLNDNRLPVQEKEIFNSDGTFKIDENGEEVGKNKLIEKSRGYISFVKGENPFMFPFRIWPYEFAEERTFKNNKYPRVQLNNRSIIQPIEYLSLYLVKLNEQQQIAYDFIINTIKNSVNENKISIDDVIMVGGDEGDEKNIEDNNANINEIEDKKLDENDKGDDEVNNEVVNENIKNIKKKLGQGENDESDEDENDESDEDENAESDEDENDESDEDENAESDKDENTESDEDENAESDEDENDEGDDDDNSESDEDENAESDEDDNAESDEVENAESDDDESIESYEDESIENSESESDNEKKNYNKFEKLNSFGYTLLQHPIEALNIIYPHKNLYTNEQKLDIRELVGKIGLNRIMSYKESMSPPSKYNFEYKETPYKNMFSYNEIGKYSIKIKTICDNILKSTGIVLVFSQYIDSGIIPLALALEELGFIRAGENKSLFKNKPTPNINALTFKEQTENDNFTPAKYAIISGDKFLSPNNVDELKLITDINNKDGSQVKVVIISKAGAEGLDFKYIRQVHILEPWYNMNRIEQIIGRAVRTCSHKDLPFIMRNVEIYLYGSLLNNKDKEAADLYIYRMAELKSLKIGLVSRVLKENSVDCLLNNNLGYNFNQFKNTVKQELSSGKIIDYKIEEKPFSSQCDYMENCLYKCNVKQDIDINNLVINLNTYNENYLFSNQDKIIKKIKKLFLDKFYYKKSDLINELNKDKQYPLIEINSALTTLINNNTMYLVDKYDRLGNLVNIDDMYLFQPLELTNKNISIFNRVVPLYYKRNKLSYILPIKNKNKVKLIQEKEEKQKIINDKDVKPENKNKDIKIINPKNVNKGKKIAEKITLLYNISINNIDDYDKRQIDEWYKKVYGVMIYLNENLNYDLKILKNIVLEHILEELLFNDIIELLNYLETIQITYLTNIEKQIKKYYTKKYLNNKNKKITGLLLQDNNKHKLIIKNISIKPNKWIIAKSEDYEDLKLEFLEISKKYFPVDSKFNKIVGFMSTFKNNYMIFKVKNLEKKNNKGARCDQTNKQNVIKLINEINDEELFDKNTILSRIELCIVQELMLRFLNKVENVCFYVNPYHTALINFEEIHY